MLRSMGSSAAQVDCITDGSWRTLSMLSRDLVVKKDLTECSIRTGSEPEAVLQFRAWPRDAVPFL